MLRHPLLFASLIVSAALVIAVNKPRGTQCPPPRSVLVHGESGLGNSLFQIAAALHYVRHHNMSLWVDADSPALQWGTSRFAGRDAGRKKSGGARVSYFETVLKNVRKSPLDTCFTRQPLPLYKEIFNAYNDTIAALPPGFNGALVIRGFHQHKTFVLDALSLLPRVLNLRDDGASRYLQRVYGLTPSSSPQNIMLGVRRGADFAHMTKISDESYVTALRHVFRRHKTPASWRLIVVADVSVSVATFQTIVDRAVEAVNIQHRATVTVVTADDMTQLQAALLCDTFVLSESTFHYWMAVLRTAIAPAAPPHVVVFDDTDLTNRPLALDDWERVAY